MEKNCFKIFILLFFLLLFSIYIAPNKSFAAAYNLSNSLVSLSKTSYTYSGYQCKPDVSVKQYVNGQYVVIQPKYYTVSYSNNINAGTASVTVTAKSYYKSSFIGSKTKTFTINKKDISYCGISLSNTSFVYNGKSQIPTITVKYNDKILTRGNSYIINVPDDNTINAGNCKKILIKGMGNFVGIVYKYYDIVPKSISSAKVILDRTEFSYTGEEIKPNPIVTIDNKTLEKDKDYTVTYKLNTNVGTGAIVRVVGKGNYKDTAKDVSFSIKKGDISNCTFSIKDDSLVYDGYPKYPTLTIKNGSTELIKDTDYTVSYSNNINAGSATARIIGQGNYYGSNIINYTIKRRSIADMNIILSQTIYEYDGNEKRPDVTISTIANGNYIKKRLGQINKKLVLGTDYYIINYFRNINAGTATVRIGGMKNYCGLIDKEFTINKKSIKDASLKLNKTEFIYDGTEKIPIPTLKIGNKELERHKDYDYKCFNNVNAGKATIEIVGKGNYKDTISSTYMIDKNDVLKSEESGDLVLFKNYTEYMLGKDSTLECYYKGNLLKPNVDYILSIFEKEYSFRYDETKGLGFVDYYIRYEYIGIKNFKGSINGYKHGNKGIISRGTIDCNTFDYDYLNEKLRYKLDDYLVDVNELIVEYNKPINFEWFDYENRVRHNVSFPFTMRYDSKYKADAIIRYSSERQGKICWW